MQYDNNRYKRLSTAIILALSISGCSSTSEETLDNAPPESNNQVPLATAGIDLIVSKNFNVTLNGNDSSDADEDELSFTWTQTAGPDVTDGMGYLTGATPTFQAPEEIDTLMFDLVVNDGTEDSTIDSVYINVLEDANSTYFVDGDNGSDITGVGSQTNPFASIAKAICEISEEQQDIYVMTRSIVPPDVVAPAYNETVDPCPVDAADPTAPQRNADLILNIPTGTSLYGGYDNNWHRQALTNATIVDTLHHGFRFISVDLNAWFSGFAVSAFDSPSPAESVTAVSVINGSATINILDNQLIAGNVAAGTAPAPGSSYGLIVALTEHAVIERNEIAAGQGGNGLSLDIGYTTAATSGDAGTGDNAGYSNTGSSGGAGGNGNHGGRGGNGGTGAGENGSNGARGQGDVALRGLGGCGGGNDNGASGCVGEKDNGDHGWSGSDGGAGGNGTAGSGGTGQGNFNVEPALVSFAHGQGDMGASGTSGGGGAGGGGGEATLAGINGGGGGGGGGGGHGGKGGFGGPGGGASIGLFIAGVTLPAEIHNNLVSSAQGGNGATGSQGQSGGAGGARGLGAQGNGTASSYDKILYAGHGGNGGNGGPGGRGGAGGGGPSYGIALGNNTEANISNNTISSGNAGNGGFGDVGGGGDAGHSYTIFDNNINDGLFASLANNTLNYGSAGIFGETTGTSSFNGNDGVAAAFNW